MRKEQRGIKQDSVVVDEQFAKRMQYILLIDVLDMSVCSRNEYNGIDLSKAILIFVVVVINRQRVC